MARTSEIMPRLRIAAVSCLLVFAAGCSSVKAPLAPSAVELSPAIDAPCLQTTRGCIALNPDVTESNLQQTVCTAGYTRTIRPPSSYTNGVKIRLLQGAGID